MDALSPAGIVEEFLERWRNSDLPEKMPEPQVVPNGQRVELILIAAYEPHQRKGYASRALRLLTALCDENGVTIELVARSMGPDLCPIAGCPPSLTTEQLIAWYERHDFVETAAPGDDTHTMIRQPRAAAG